MPLTLPAILERYWGYSSFRPLQLEAMEAVMAKERRLGREPRDVSQDRRGYDVESKDPASGQLYFLEVKGRVAGAATEGIPLRRRRNALR